MTGTSSMPRSTRPTRAGNVSSLARSPVAPKMTNASTLSSAMSSPQRSHDDPIRSQPWRSLRHPARVNPETRLGSGQTSAGAGARRGSLAWRLARRGSLGGDGGADSLGDVFTDPDAVGDGGQSWIDRPDAREEAGVGDVQIVDFVRLAVHVENGCRRVRPESARACLVSAGRERDVHAHVEVLVQHMVRGQADVIEDLLQLGVQIRSLALAGLVAGQVDLAVAVYRDPVFWPWQVLSGQPEVDGVAGCLSQRPVREQLGQVRF